MLAVRVTIAGFIDEQQPGWVECNLVDAHGKTWKFNEKAPVVSNENLRSDSEYPKQGSIVCTALHRQVDGAGRLVVTVDMISPWGIESTDGSTIFDVYAEQIEDYAAGN
jgi:hypothetical protein